MAAGEITIAGSIIPDTNERPGNHVLVWGKVQLDGTNPTPVSLSGYLSSVTTAVATIVATSPVGDDLNGVYLNVSGTTLNIEVYKNTATDNPTYTDSTNNAAEVHFFAAGVK